jgi:microcystin-dependent protein
VKRAPFLGAAAALLTGCGGHQVLRALPGVASKQNQNSTASLRLVPDVPEAIPANVLASPIIGEARRFAGSTPPSGWMFAQGQTLQVAQYPQVTAVLRNRSVANGAITFPKFSFPVIIAVAGLFPTSPAVLSQSTRRSTSTASLGAGAQQVFSRTLSPRAQAAQEQRDVAIRKARERVAAMPLPPRSAGSVPISAELSSRIAQSRADARATALSRLSEANRGRVEALVDAVVVGRISTHAAQLEMASALTPGEATMLLGVHDAHERAFRSGWAGMAHPEPQSEAANFVVDITFTPDQERAFARLPENR